MQVYNKSQVFLRETITVILKNFSIDQIWITLSRLDYIALLVKKQNMWNDLWTTVLLWLKLCRFDTGIYMYFVRYSKTPRTQTLGAHAEFCEVNIRSPSLFYLYYCRQISTMLIVFWGIIKINTGFNIRPCD